VAPPRIPRQLGQPHNRQSLFRYLFPHVRQSVRERISDFKHETLPYYKVRAQSRIYNYLVKKSVKRREKRVAGTRIVDILRRRGGTVFGRLKNNAIGDRIRQRLTMSGFQNLDDGEAASRERSGRRRQLAGYLKAANEVRRSYQASYSEKWNADKSMADEDMKGIPGSFPDVAIVSYKDEQLVLFPSYAKHHVKTPPDMEARRKEREKESSGSDSDSDAEKEAEYWAREWQKYEDDHAVVDVDVRGWIYTPHTGPMSRKMRVMLGLVRQLSGVPAPKVGSRDNSPDSNPNSLAARHKEREQMREEEKIAAEAEKILSQGEAEQAAAARGKYSEVPRPAAEMQHVYGEEPTPGSNRPGTLNKRASWTQPADMSPAELLQANTHLMARIAPFLTNPMVSSPVTVFFYDENQSVSRTVTTNEAGHFNLRAPLEFIPTHVRVLASEHLSATEEVKITASQGVSLITDIDDTIKHSSIGSGAREIFRNAFIRDLGDLTIDGVKEWYNTMYDMGVGIHYVSNSPWQLFPILVSFFGQAGLPPGSYHLKQYSGMLQGIFEPVAERKKVTLERILRDFPERKFVLVGDSGEADLEVYTDVVLAHPGRILAIYIRDVTTPEGAGFFDSAMGPLASGPRPGSALSSKIPGHNNGDDSDNLANRPQLPQRPASEVVSQTSDGPTMGTLIDFGQEDEPSSVHKSHRTVLPRSISSDDTILSPGRTPSSGNTRKAPPARPAKPQALRGNASTMTLPEELTKSNHNSGPPKPPAPRRGTGGGDLAKTLSKQSSSASLKSVDSGHGYMDSARSKIAAAYNSLPEVRSHLPLSRSRKDSDAPSINTTESSMPQPLQRAGNAAGNAAAGAAGFVTSKIPSVMDKGNITDSDDESTPSPNIPVNKKLDLWKRRYKRSKDILDAKGVTLRTWRVGQDVCIDSVQLVEKTLREMGVEGYGPAGKTGKGGGEVKVKDVKK